MKRPIQLYLLAMALICVLIIWGWMAYSERTMQPTVIATTAFPLDIPSPEPFTPSLTPDEEGPIPFPSPQVTPQPETIYMVQAGDTLWDIAMQFSLTIDALIRANPNLNAAGLIFPGDQLLIPSSAETINGSNAETWPTNARVSADGEGLRLRLGPGLDYEIILNLAALTPLTVMGRTADNTWLQIRTPYQDQGWVFSEWVDVFVNLDEVPVVAGNLASPTTTAISASATLSIPSLPPIEDYEYISGVTEHSRQIFQLGQSLGNRANIFSKVGDSITVSSAFLNPIGTGQYYLHQYDYLQPLIDYYSASWARTHNSFANVSLAAKVGWSAQALNMAELADEDYCSEIETPLECEYRWVKPSIALIMLGTNDVPSTPVNSFESAMREIIETTIDHGIIPIISTIPPMHLPKAAGRVELLNGVIIDLAQEYDIPLWDYWAALQGLPDEGLGSDGVHPSLALYGHNADFTSPYLQSGMPVRNLTALQALDVVWRTILQGE
jgi:LysM repeat protein